MPIARPAAPVTLEALELRVLHLPLVSPFTTSFGTESVREVIVVRARTSDGDGWGEIVTQREPYYSSEYTYGAWDVSQRFLAPALLETGTFAPEQIDGTVDLLAGLLLSAARAEQAHGVNPQVRRRLDAAVAAIIAPLDNDDA